MINKLTPLLFLTLLTIHVAFGQKAPVVSDRIYNLDIKSQQTDSLPSPPGLQAEVTGSDVLLTWFPPGNGPGSWLTYADSTLYTFIGYTSEGSFEAAARWTTEQLEAYDGELLTSVDFIPGSLSSTFILKIWTGENAEELIWEQDIVVEDSLVWQETFIQNPILIDASRELWIGIEIQQQDADFPMGVDFGPAIEGFGDMIRYESPEWSTLTDLGLSFNWMIRAFVTLSDDSEVRQLLRSPEKNPLVSGYNVYRDQEKLNDTPLEELQYSDLGLEDGFYTYGVTAVYDSLESEPATIEVQFGGPLMTLLPDTINVELSSDSTEVVEIELLNSGGEMLEWNAVTQTEWIVVSADSGEVSPGDTVNLELTFDAEALLSGIYYGSVTFNTNNINDPETLLSVTMVVTGNPDLTVSTDTLNFGAIIIDNSALLSLMIGNEGTDDLFVTGITSSDDYFTTDENEFYLQPGEYGFVNVTFQPDAQGQFDGILTILSNDDSNPTLEVSLLGQGTLPLPLNLQASAEGNVANLSWLDPAGGPGTYLYYGDGINASAVGVVSGATWQIASLWTTDQLEPYSGESITKTNFYFFQGVAEYTLKIWSYDSIPELLYEQYIGLVTEEEAWNEVFLNEPFPVDGESDLLIGFEINQEPDGFPAGVDAGPAVTGYGDLVSLDGIVWGSLADYGLDFNWSLQVFVTGETQPAPLPLQNKSHQVIPGLQLATTPAGSYNKSSLRSLQDLLGFNVYRNENKLNDTLVTEYAYQDTLTDAGEYNYTVTAVYDEGESEPAGPVTVVIDSITIMAPQGWQMTESNIHHQLWLPETLISNENNDLMPGDFVGVFFAHDGQHLLAGMTYWDGSDTEFTAFGDHFLTPEKDGFVQGDELFWKIYRPAEDKEYDALPDYDPAMPDHNGMFAEDGLSGLRALQIEALSTPEAQASERFILFPNPASGKIYIQGVSTTASIMILGQDGRVMQQLSLPKNSSGIDISSLPSGIYQLVIASEEGMVTKTFLVR
ncbi:MAG: DUF1573 domain-containing protein [bacterium]